MKILVVKKTGHGKSGSLFEGRVDGELIVESTTTPFCDAARSLIAAGVDPTTEFVMRHSSRTDDVLRATVGAAAALTVEETGRGPRFRKFRSYDAPATLSRPKNHA